MQILYPGGLWFDPRDAGRRHGGGALPRYSLEDRKLQFARLEGLGTPPTPAERSTLLWPQREWWDDRDRIVLLYECIIDEEESWLREVEGHGAPAFYQLVEERALALWLEEETKVDGPDAVMAGYRFLTSLPSTPRRLRLPMHPELFRDRAAGRRPPGEPGPLEMPSRSSLSGRPRQGLGRAAPRMASRSPPSGLSSARARLSPAASPPPSPETVPRLDSADEEAEARMLLGAGRFRR